MFTFASDGSPRRGGSADGALVGASRLGAFRRCWVMAVGPGRAVVWRDEDRRLAAGAGWAVLVGGGRLLGRRGGRADEVIGGLAAAFALFGRESVGGSLFVVGLAGGERVGDPEVAGDDRVLGAVQVGHETAPSRRSRW